MLPDTVTGLNAYLANSTKCATSGIKHIMAFAEEMQTYIDTLPDDLKPFAEMLNKLTMQVLIEMYAESLWHIPELALQEIARAALPPNHQTEKE